MHDDRLIYTDAEVEVQAPDHPVGFPLPWNSNDDGFGFFRAIALCIAVDLVGALIYGAWRTLLWLH